MKTYRISYGMMLFLFLAVVSCGPEKGKNGTASTEKPGAKALRPIELLIDWQAEPTYVGVFYAKALGLFEKEGLDATVIESWGANQATAAVAAGRYLVGTASGGATVLAVDRNQPIVSMAVLFPQIPTVIYGLATNGIRKPTDLYGKTIGYYAGSITVNEYEAFIAANGLDRTQITETTLSGSDIPLLKEGVVDAVLNYRDLSPALLELDDDIPVVGGQRINAVFLRDWGVESYGLNVITNRDALEKEPDTVRAITHAIVEGYRQGCLDQTSAIDAFMKTFPEKDEAYMRNGWRISCEQIGSLDGIGQQDYEGWGKTIRTYADLGLLIGDVAAEQILPTFGSREDGER